MKEVPPESVRLRIDPDSGRLARRNGHLNGPDEHALEQALRVGDHAGGEVVAISRVPEHATNSLRHGVAMGVDGLEHQATAEPCAGDADR